MTCHNFNNQSTDKGFMAKKNFASAREIITIIISGIFI